MSRSKVVPKMSDCVCVCVRVCVCVLEAGHYSGRQGDLQMTS
jgi:hypothetical protein